MKNTAINFCAMAFSLIATLLVPGGAARATSTETTDWSAPQIVEPTGPGTVLYRWDTSDPPVQERFNNSQGVETEDNWVASAFQVVAGGTRLLSIEYPLGETFVARAATVAIYQGFDISDPLAGCGLVRIHTTETTLTGERGSRATLMLGAPVDLGVGDVFYAAILIRGVTGDLFPFWNQTSGGTLGHSFFDVGPMQGAAYDLDVTVNARVNGATHPVVGAGVQSPGATLLRVNATTP